MEARHVTAGEAETRALGREVGQRVQAGTILALEGPLGVGKSVFASGVAEALGVEGAITSPSYTIVCEYEGRRPFYHIDLYRINSVEEFFDLGIEDLLFGGSGISVIEWAERADEVLRDSAHWIRFRFQSDKRREIAIPAEIGPE